MHKGYWQKRKEKKRDKKGRSRLEIGRKKEKKYYTLSDIVERGFRDDISWCINQTLPVDEM